MTIDFSHLLFHPGRQPGDIVPPPVVQAAEIIVGGDRARDLAMRPRDLADKDELEGPWDMEVKLDGYCALHIGGRMVTLEGNPYDAATHALSAIAEMERIAGEPLFLHGEMVEEDGFDATAAAFQRGRGEGTLWLHDIAPLDMWVTGRAIALPRAVRQEMLRELVEQVNSPFVGLIRSHRLEGEALGEGIQSVFSLGAEGVVLKRPGSFYRRGRGDDAIRVKAHKIVDLVVLEVLAAGGKVARLLCRRADRSTAILPCANPSVALEIEKVVAAGRNPVIEAIEHKRVGAKNVPMTFHRFRKDRING